MVNIEWGKHTWSEICEDDNILVYSKTGNENRIT